MQTKKETMAGLEKFFGRKLCAEINELTDEWTGDEGDSETVMVLCDDADRKYEEEVNRALEEAAENAYFWCSDIGRFKGSERAKPTFGTLNDHGYYTYKGVVAAKIVLAVHGTLPSAPEKWTTNHKDLNPKNNCRKNVEWASPRDQTNHAHETNTNRSKHHFERPVEGWRVDKKRNRVGEIIFFPSVKAAAEKCNSSVGNVTGVCRGYNLTAKGYSFRYHEQPSLEGETWENAVCNGKDIDGCRVSTLGRVELLGVKGWGSLTPGGYRCFMLCQKSYRVHKVVLETFLGPRPKGCTVNHKNDQRSDNRLENLEWATATDQQQQKKKNGDKYIRSHEAGTAKRSYPVKARRVYLEGEWELFESYNSAARELTEKYKKRGIVKKFLAPNIRGVCMGERRQHLGYVFKFADPSSFESLEGEKWIPVPTELFERIRMIGPPEKTDLQKQLEAEQRRVRIGLGDKGIVVNNKGDAATYLNRELAPKKAFLGLQITNACRSGRPYQGIYFSYVDIEDEGAEETEETEAVTEKVTKIETKTTVEKKVTITKTKTTVEKKVAKKRKTVEKTQTTLSFTKDGKLEYKKADDKEEKEEEQKKKKARVEK